MINIGAIPFFDDKRVELGESLYSNDSYPTCFFVSDGAANYKVRSASKFNLHAIARERNVLNYLAEQGKSFAPYVFEAQTANDGKPQYIVESFFPGKSLEKYEISELEAYVDLLAQGIFTYICELHSIRASYFHSFINDSYSNYFDMITAHLLKHINIISEFDRELTVCLNKVTDVIASNKECARNITPTLLHFDLKPQNIIFDKKTLSLSFIDYEHSRFGDPLHELVRARLKSRLYPPFYQNIWRLVEGMYFQKYHIENMLKDTLYRIYFYAAELPFLFQTQECEAIEKMRKSIYDESLRLLRL